MSVDAGQRPVYFIGDLELRGQLAEAFPAIAFRSTPCDIRVLRHLADGFGIESATPSAISLDLESEKAKVGEAADKAAGLCSLLANGNK